MMKHFQLLRKPIFRDAVGDSPRSWDPGRVIVILHVDSLEIKQDGYWMLLVS